MVSAENDQAHFAIEQLLSVVHSFRHILLFEHETYGLVWFVLANSLSVRIRRRPPCGGEFVGQVLVLILGLVL